MLCRNNVQKSSSNKSAPNRLGSARNSFSESRDNSFVRNSSHTSNNSRHSARSAGSRKSNEIRSFNRGRSSSRDSSASRDRSLSAHQKSELKHRERSSSKHSTSGDRQRPGSRHSWASEPDRIPSQEFHVSPSGTLLTYRRQTQFHLHSFTRMQLVLGTILIVPLNYSDILTVTIIVSTIKIIFYLCAI